MSEDFSEFFAQAGELGLEDPNLPTFETYYDGTGIFWIPDYDAGWTRVTASGAKRYLKLKGISGTKADDESLSPLDQTLLHIERGAHVVYAGPLAGHKAGLIEQANERILVTSSPHLITPRRGTFPTINQLLDGLLGEQQRIYFDSWLSVAVKSLYESNHRQGQALVLAGPTGCGKSFVVEHIITQLLGGRSAKPYQFMTGQTPFNGELFGAESLVIDDEAASTDIRSRQNLGSWIKQFVAAQRQNCHAKYQSSLTLKPFWRPIICCNDDAEHLAVLPPLDDSIQDKLILFKAEKKEMPISTTTTAGWLAFQEAVEKDLPAYAHSLLEMEIPAEIRCERFGVKHFHHPDIVQGIHDLSPEMRSLALIDAVIDDFPWQGTAVDLIRDLTKQDSPVQSKGRELHPKTLGKHLHSLCRIVPGRVRLLPRPGNTNAYEILSP